MSNGTRAKTAIILGARGRFGRAARAAFLEAGWRVKALARRWDALPKDGAQQVEADAFDREALAEACWGADVIVNALNPPYADWERDLPRFTDAVLHAAEMSGATIMISGNVYGFGAAAPELLSEDAPKRPTTKKGRLRLEMEQSYEAAAARGIRTVILRGGDFIDGVKTGNWFEDHMTHRLDQGEVVYPGPLDRVHAWAYLPDMARAMAALAERRDALPAFAAIGFEGYSLTGEALIAALAEVAGRPLRRKGFSWTMLRLGALFSAHLREVLEMRYLWRTPHRIDGAPLRRLLPEFEPTPLHAALAAATGRGRTGS